MNLKSIYPLLIGVIFIMGCSLSKNVAKREIIKKEEDYVKINFTPASFSQEITPGLEILITPIDAKEMNKIAFEATFFDGDYDKTSSVVTMIEEQLSQKNLTKEERARISYIKQVVDYIKEKVNKGELNKTIGDNLIWKLWHKAEGTEGKETNLGKGYPEIYNPYKANINYLSVFQLTFKNSSKTIKRIKLNELLFNSGYEQLYPFEHSYFERIYNNDQEKLRMIYNIDQEKLRMIYRINMPNELIVPPDQTVIKYVSIPSLNPKTKDLDIKLIQEDKMHNFQFKVQVEEQSQTTFLEKITFKAQDEYKFGILRYYFVLITPDNQLHIIKDNSLFLPQEILNDRFSIYGIATNPTGYLFTKLENFTISQFNNHEVMLKFEKEVKFKR